MIWGVVRDFVCAAPLDRRARREDVEAELEAECGWLMDAGRGTGRCQGSEVQGSQPAIGQDGPYDQATGAGSMEAMSAAGRAMVVFMAATSTALGSAARDLEGGASAAGCLVDVANAIQAGFARAILEREQFEGPRDYQAGAGASHGGSGAGGAEPTSGDQEPGAGAQEKPGNVYLLGEISPAIWKALRRLVFSTFHNRIERRAAVEVAIEALFALLMESEGRAEYRQGPRTQGSRPIGGLASPRELWKGSEDIAALYSAGRASGGITSEISMAMNALSRVAEGSTQGTSKAALPLAEYVDALARAIEAEIDRISEEFRQGERLEDIQPAGAELCDGGAGGRVPSSKVRVQQGST